MPLCAAPIGLVPTFGLTRPQARKRLCARRRYEAGEPILRLDHPRWILTARSGAIEMVDGRRFFDPLLDLIAHSENPNVRVSPELLALIARRDIAPNEPLTRNWGPGSQRDMVDEEPGPQTAVRRRVTA